MSLSNYLENQLLNHIRGVAYSVPAGLYVKLHLGDPGEDCVNNAAAETTRKLVAFGAASGGSMSATGSPVAQWTNFPANETVSHFSVWDAVSGGNPLGKGALSSSSILQIGDTLQLNALTWNLD